MAVKYECPKCGRRFIDWGAEKLGYKCPGCSGVGVAEIVKLIRIGSDEEAALPSATLRRRATKAAVVAAVPVPELEEPLDEEVDDEEVVEEEEAEPVVIGAAAHVVVDDEVVDEDADEDASDEEAPVDLDFGVEKVEFDEGPVPEFED